MSVEPPPAAGGSSPAPPSQASAERLSIPSQSFDHLTHYLFRYPAKFHPPVVRTLINSYTTPRQTILDPFCGSGTALVEAAVLGRHSIGLDIDPLAVEVSWAKTHKFHQPHLRESARRLVTEINKLSRSAQEYEDRAFSDLPELEYDREAAFLQEWIPPIPKLHHWFRRYVIVDLARIRRAIWATSMPATHRRFFLVVFASIIRNSSNADPVPVSGLEVTIHMRRRDAEGRVVNPFKLYLLALTRALGSSSAFATAAASRYSPTVRRADATFLATHLKTPVDAVITSPPYHGAVDYYRRHQLEMYWLGLTTTHNERLGLLQRYVGRPKVGASHPYVAQAVVETALAKEWEEHLRLASSERANAFKHYMVAMSRFFVQLSQRLPAGAIALLIVGHSSWNDGFIPTSSLFEELAHHLFILQETLWYPVKNRYMSYSRHNGANIDTEYVLVMRRM